jgi:hypothetical protein
MLISEPERLKLSHRKVIAADEDPFVEIERQI